MAITISRSTLNTLDFSFEEAFNAYVQAREEHANTINIPAPTAHPLVEQAYFAGGYIIDEDVQEETEPEPEPPTVQELLDYLGRKRVEVEEGGIVFNGITVATDRAHSQVKLTAAYIKAVNDPSFKITNWKIAPGVFIPEIDANTIIAMGDAVTAHIQACFNKEAELAAKITADPPQITTYQEIDEADWPSNS